MLLSKRVSSSEFDTSESGPIESYECEAAEGGESECDILFIELSMVTFSGRYEIGMLI